MTSRFDTPILFLLFNRPDTTQVVFDQIKKQKPKQLFFAADGPRQSVTGEKEKCEEARDIIRQVDWDCEVKTLFRNQNLGCGPAVSAAITWFFQQVEEGIILEDDCFPDASFFPYCQELLIKYRHVNQVKLIGGNNFQNGIKRGKGSYYFSHYPEIWGWGSWRRAWEEYDFDMHDLEETLSAGALKDKFKTNAERNYWYKKFRQTKEGKINTWDYQFVYAILKANGMAITPQVNLVKNIGINNQPTHYSLADSQKNLQTYSLAFPLIHPQVAVDQTADRYTFSQIYSRSPKRLLRLIKENGVNNVLRYFLQKLFS